MLYTALVVACLVETGLAFSFSLDTSSPSQCNTIGVDWSGGTPPFSLTIIPVFDYPVNVSMPSSAWNSGSQTGSYKWTVNYPSGTSFVALMSDATGVGTGGVSPLHSVASSTATCTQRSTQTDFLFYINATTVTQCTPVEIYWDSTAVAPVTIIGAIPGGQAFQLNTNAKSTSVMWNANIASGTQFILSAFDSGTLYQGGSSNLLTVAGSSNNKCLDDSSPSSTVATPTASATASGSQSKTNGGGAVKTVTAIASAPAGAGLQTGTIVGIVVGVVSLVLILQTVLVWFCCRRQLQALLASRKQNKNRQTKAGDVDLLSNGGHSVTRNETDGDIAASMADWTGRSRGDRTSRAMETVRSRTSVGDDYAESSISPFWDGAAIPHTPDPDVGRRGSGSSTPGERTFLAPNSENDRLDSPSSLDPPRLPHLRTESLGSMFDHPLSDAYDGVSQTSLTYSPSGLLATQTPPSHSPSPLPLPLAGLSPGSSSRPSGSMTKAQMASSLSASNPDPESYPSPPSSNATSAPTNRIPRTRDEFSERLPPQQAPRGGFRLHEDAGRLDEVEVEDLPPMYSPNWQGPSPSAD